MKKKKKEKKILYQLIFSAFLLFSNAYLVKANSDILQMFVYNPSIINVIRFRLVFTDKKGGSSYRYYTMNLTGVGN